MYLLVGAFFFYIQKHTLVSTQKSDEKILNMALSAFVPEVIPPMEDVIREEEVLEEIVEPEIIKEPMIQEEPKTKEEPVIEPIVEKVIPKPIVKKKKKVKKKIKKKRHKKKKVSQKISAQRSERSKAQKNQFLANIRAKINKNKFYPRIAKKRRMQGSVKVKFTILRSGKVGHISVLGPKVFHSSAKKQ